MTRWGKVLVGTALAVLAPLACANLDGLAGGGASAGPGAADGSPDGSSAADASLASATAGFSISARELSFAFDCSKPSGPKSSDLALINASDAPIPFELTLDPSATFAFADVVVSGDGGVSGLVPAHGRTNVRLIAQNAPTSAAETGTLHVHTGDFDDVVLLTATAEGPRLEIEPAIADFGFVRQNVVSEPISMLFTNTGTRPTTVQAFDPQTSDFKLPSSLVVPAGASVSADVTMTGGAAGLPIDLSVRAVPSDLGCGEVPSIRLKGQRVSSDVIVSPVTLDFGQVACNATPTSQLKFTITNYKPTQSVAYTATLPVGSKFSLNTPPGTVPAATGSAPGKAEIAVSVKPLGTATGDFTESLAVSIDGGATTNVSLHVRSNGAKIALLTPSLDFSRNQTKSAFIANSGNATLCVSYGVVSTEPNTPFYVQSSGNLVVGSNNAVGVTYNASDGKDHVATVQMTPVACTGSTAPTPVCSPLPTLPVHGNK